MGRHLAEPHRVAAIAVWRERLTPLLNQSRVSAKDLSRALGLDSLRARHSVVTEALDDLHQVIKSSRSQRGAKLDQWIEARLVALDAGSLLDPKQHQATQARIRDAARRRRNQTRADQIVTIRLPRSRRDALETVRIELGLSDLSAALGWLLQQNASARGNPKPKSSRRSNAPEPGPDLFGILVPASTGVESPSSTAGPIRTPAPDKPTARRTGGRPKKGAANA